MNLRDLTDGQIRNMQGVCDQTFRDLKKAHGILLSEHELWRKAFSRGVEAAMTMFEKEIQAGQKSPLQDNVP